MEVVKNIAAVVGCISAVIALVGTIVKPVRKKFVNWVKHTSEASETSMAIQDINTKLASLTEKVDAVGKNNENTKQEILQRINDIDRRMQMLDKRVFENERDRIKAELSEYSARCARGMKLYPEEKIHIDEIYQKYTDELHCNSTGSDFYHGIIKYYEQQDWLKG